MPRPVPVPVADRAADGGLADLEAFAYRLRQLTVEMVAWGQWGHIAGSVSMAEILAVLYGRVLRHDPARPDDPDRDRLVLSKAHASPGLYAALAIAGYFPEAAIYGYCDPQGILEGHADMTRTPGLESSGGLLGMGLSVAQGMALGARLAGRSAATYCIVGDGELNEGNIWEAAMSAGALRLGRLVAIVDHNRIMSKGLVEDQVGIEPIGDKFRAFRWRVIDVPDGHDLPLLLDAIGSAARAPQDEPTVVVARTVKGRGIEDGEGTPRWHTHAPNPQVADDMLRALARRYGRPETGYSRIDLPVRREVFDV